MYIENRAEKFPPTLSQTDARFLSWRRSGGSEFDKHKAWGRSPHATFIRWLKSGVQQGAKKWELDSQQLEEKLQLDRDHQNV